MYRPPSFMFVDHGDMWHSRYHREPSEAEDVILSLFFGWSCGLAIYHKFFVGLILKHANLLSCTAHSQVIQIGFCVVQEAFHFYLCVCRQYSIVLESQHWEAVIHWSRIPSSVPVVPVGAHYCIEDEGWEGALLFFFNTFNKHVPLQNNNTTC